MSARKGGGARVASLSAAVVFVVLITGGLSVAQNIISRGSFPNGFVFGTATSAYQCEGAVKEDGRGQTIWDTYAHFSGKVIDNSNADVAVDHYHRYPEDIRLMKAMGMDAYRFSIAWSRILPNGTGKINRAGIDHYNNVINMLLAHGIEPYVTLYHWDLPQALEDKYNGWLNPQIINDFATYAETCFQEFGDRVKYWITMNEPHNIAFHGYSTGILAPGRCSGGCPAGNSSTEPYIVAHNLLLSHAATVNIYKNKYKAKQGGRIGVSMDSFWYEPLSNSTADHEATQRALDFNLGWFLEPVTRGNYPGSMRSRVGKRLPIFSRSEYNLLRGSYDFIGINHYTTWYASNGSSNNPFIDNSDSGTISQQIKGTTPIGEKANSIWLYIVPRGMKNLMNYIRNKYENPLVIITENGMDDAKADGPRDAKRIKYLNDYLTNLLVAIKDGCNVKGYFVWSVLDNWEWTAGYTSRFGLYYVDYDHNLTRIPKHSVKWFRDFLASP